MLRAVRGIVTLTFIIVAVSLLGHMRTNQTISANFLNNGPAKASAEIDTRQTVPTLHSLLGEPVGKTIGSQPPRIIDVLADSDGRVTAAVIEFGGFLGLGTRKVAINWSDLRFEKDGKRDDWRIRAVVLLSSSELQSAQEYTPNSPMEDRHSAE
jgi:hypothetical protein